MTRCEAFILAYDSPTIEAFEIALKFSEETRRFKDGRFKDGQFTMPFEPTEENIQLYYKLAHTSIREIREARNLSQGSFGREVGVGLNTVRKWETPATSKFHCTIPAATFFLILEHFGVIK